MVDLDAGQPLGEVVDHVVALQLAVRDDVDAGDLLILDRRLAAVSCISSRSWRLIRRWR